MTMIRPEHPDDVAAVRRLHESIFETPNEADLVDALREACEDHVSLVAVEGEHLVGHVFFSPVSVAAGSHEVMGMGLAPMAIATERQRQGIGSRLVKRGLDMLREGGCPYVVVLGHAEYYPRFGFEPASRHGLLCPWEDVPDENFLVAVNDHHALKHAEGPVRYRPEFDAAT
jgi:putative acetyltransferase